MSWVYGLRSFFLGIGSKGLGFNFVGFRFKNYGSIEVIFHEIRCFSINLMISI